MILSNGQLAELGARLDEHHETLLEEIRGELEDTDSQQYIELIGREPADIGDQSVGDALADLNLAIIDRHVRELREIEAAQSRMRTGEYGLCADCGTEIGFDRLLVRPTAARCVPCQEQRERVYAHEGTPKL
jgi:DnaK suppressor protein